MNKFCYDQIKKYEKYHIQNDTEEGSVVDIIGKLVCPNDCSANGVCNEGMYVLILIYCPIWLKCLV